ncbi:hypothetical protein QUA83_04610 [Microcoleus sp. K1-B1]|uniref:hypothetical protein n=1 Tax=Microcoleus sp. K1-B6 TaxID=2818787 RepID=UPI002FD7B42B
MTASGSSLFGWAHNQAQGWRSPAGSSFGEPNTPLLGKMGLSRGPLISNLLTSELFLSLFFSSA